MNYQRRWTWYAGLELEVSFGRGCGTLETSLLGVWWLTGVSEVPDMVLVH